VYGFSETYQGWRNFGKTIDNKIFHNGAATAYNNATGSTTYNGTPYTYVQHTMKGDVTVSGTYFESLYDMSNFMWSKSEELQTEISGYILVDKDGKESYWVNSWEGNKENKSDNIWFPDKNGKPTLDNKQIVAQIHTHPSQQYGKYWYDGNSYEDYIASKNIGVPVFSIGPTSVSMIYAPTSQYTRTEQFLELAKNRYVSEDVNGNLYPNNPYKTNPYYISDTKIWLSNPFLQFPFIR